MSDLAETLILDLITLLFDRKHADSGGAFRVQVYSPYILINKTGCDFALKTKTFLSSAKNVAGQELFSGELSYVDDRT